MNPTASSAIFRVLTVALLAFIAFTLHRIQARMPVLMGDYMAAVTPAAKAELSKRQPVVTVYGVVEVNGEVDIGNKVSVVGDVEVTNRVHVQVDR